MYEYQWLGGGWADGGWGGERRVRLDARGSIEYIDYRGVKLHETQCNELVGATIRAGEL